MLTFVHVFWFVRFGLWLERGALGRLQAAAARHGATGSETPDSVS
ncbi:uncharacterized membrane protein YccF (DUF307 family) [Actinopolymorpha pittospori]|uniref:Uncharacterized membrane protein YccF (DUF307 family) n=1 Tax=Actinopolymorpha pittospori TaxID=648752 RepID=A0A927RHH1_9ACTN|nr:uncharacterized membrane protein YccF (DUF307 family) [Actinopolymorpha pittospori]